MIMTDGTSPAGRRADPDGPVPSRDERAAVSAVTAAAQAAQSGARDLAAGSADVLDEALRAISARLGRHAAQVIAANEQDVSRARSEGWPASFVDRLMLDEARLRAMSGQLLALADVPAEPTRRTIRELPGELILQERRRPVGVIGANFEARPNVVVDVASQLIKSRNAGVLRTGSSALESAAVLVDEVVGPAMRDTGLNPQAIQLIRAGGHAAAYALVRQPGLIPLVILRGSGATTRALAREGALHGVRTLAHADGGAVIYVDESADQALASRLIEASLDRLGVCNRLNLLLLQQTIWPTMLPRVAEVTSRLGVATSLPPHEHALGHEWALDTGHEATITVAPVAGATEAAELANSQTSGLAASVIAEDAAAAHQFLDAYGGTGAFWNATPRLLDGFKLLSVPETGINIDSVPGPRGPVTFRDLYLRQYAVMPKAADSGQR
jgi:glutamate-5-semialdehyde dehydrogenase